jgi:Branched-chain amino acid ABC-type transport system, permease components
VVALLSQQVLNGLIIGLVYALIALGLTMVYGVLRVIHLAHAATYALGAYVAAMLLNRQVPMPVAIVLGIAVAGALGVVIERGIYRPLLHAKPIAPLIAGLGLYFVLQDTIKNVAGPYALPFGESSAVGSLVLGPLRVTQPQILVVVVCVLLIAGVFLLIRRTPFGLRIRAVADRRDMSSAVGINVNGIVSLTFLIASVLAGVAGILVANLYSTVYPTMGLDYTLRALAVVVVGGLGSVGGAVVASLLLGVTESLLVGMFELPIGQDGVAFIFLVAVLLLRPQGLFGSRLTEKV